MKKIVAILLLVLSPQLWGGGSLMAQKRKLDVLLPQLKNSNPNDIGYVKLLNVIAKAYSFYQLDSAHVYADKAYALAKSKGDKKQMADALINKAWALSSDFRTNEAIKCAQEALQLSRQAHYITGEAYSLCFLTPVTDSVEIKIAYYKKIIGMFEKLNDAQGIAFAQNILVVAIFFTSPEIVKPIIENAIEKARAANDSTWLGRYTINYGSLFITGNQNDSALYFNNKAIAIDSAYGNHVFLSTDYGNMAAYCYYISDYPQQLKWLLKGIDAAEFSGMRSGISSMLTSAGILYFDMKKFDVAKKYLEQSISKEMATENYANISNAQGYLGVVYLETNMYDSAYYWLTESIKSANKTSDNFCIGSAYLNLGDYYRARKQYSNAFANFNVAKKLMEEIQDNYNLGYIYFSYANTVLNAPDKELAAQGIAPSTRYTVAKKYAQKALDLSRESSNPAITRDALHELYNIAEKQNNTSQAYEYYKQYVTLKDSIMSKDNANSIATLQIEYDTEKKEQQITLLNKDKALAIAEIKRQALMKNAVLGGVGIAVVFSFILLRTFNRKRKTAFEKQVAQVETKALRSQMNPHFIFNSLNSIDDYILNNDIKNSSLYVNKFSRLMRLILESSRKEEVSLKEDLESLELYMQLENLRMAKKVECLITVSPDINTENVFIPPMLLQPFIENSFKHAFYQIDSPKVEIEVSMKDDMLSCTVTDNGRGRKIQGLEAEARENRKSLGMTVTRERLEIITKIKRAKAYFTFEDLMDSQQNALGTRVLLFVPSSFAF